MAWLALVPLVVQLIGFAEKLFTGAKQGALKKSMVLGAAEAVANGMAMASTGGQKETWEAIKPMLGTIIDTTVAISNATGWVTIEDDNFEKMKNGG